MTPLHDVQVPPGWREVEETATLSRVFGDATHGTRRYFRRGPLTAILSRMTSSGWHFSIAHPSRNPTWEEVRDARYAFVPPEAWMAMLLPPPSEYVNQHQHCFQMIEVLREPRLYSDRITALHSEQ